MDITIGDSTCGQIHHFEKSRDVTFCYLCQNCWPSSDGLTSKYNYCSNCGLSVHTSCKSIAQAHIHCSPRNIYQKISTSDSHFSLPCICGNLSIQLLHMYDVPIAAGTYLYGKCKSQYFGRVVQSQASSVKDSEVTWPESALCSKENTVEWKAPARNGCHESYVMDVEIWKSVMGIFDSVVATCNFSILPLLFLPGLEVERWFAMTSLDGIPSGFLLLNMQFVPMDPSVAHMSFKPQLIYQDVDEFPLANSLNNSSVSTDNNDADDNKDTDFTEIISEDREEVPSTDIFDELDPTVSSATENISKEIKNDRMIVPPSILGSTITAILSTFKSESSELSQLGISEESTGDLLLGQKDCAAANDKTLDSTDQGCSLESLTQISDPAESSLMTDERTLDDMDNEISQVSIHTDLLDHDIASSLLDTSIVDGIFEVEEDDQQESDEEPSPVDAIFKLITQHCSKGGTRTANQICSLLNEEIIDSRDEDGNTFLILACKHKFEELVPILLQKHSNPNLINSDGVSALHHSTYQESLSVSISKSLLDYGANTETHEATFGCTPLQYAAGTGNLELCELLIAYGADIFAVDFYKNSCIDYAQDAGKADVAIVLQHLALERSSTAEMLSETIGILEAHINSLESNYVNNAAKLSIETTEQVDNTKELKFSGNPSDDCKGSSDEVDAYHMDAYSNDDGSCDSSDQDNSDIDNNEGASMISDENDRSVTSSDQEDESSESVGSDHSALVLDVKYDEDECNSVCVDDVNEVIRNLEASLRAIDDVEQTDIQHLLPSTGPEDIITLSSDYLDAIDPSHPTPTAVEQENTEPVNSNLNPTDQTHDSSDLEISSTKSKYSYFNINNYISGIGSKLASYQSLTNSTAGLVAVGSASSWGIHSNFQQLYRSTFMSQWTLKMSKALDSVLYDNNVTDEDSTNLVSDLEPSRKRISSFDDDKQPHGRDADAMNLSGASLLGNTGGHFSIADVEMSEVTDEDIANHIQKHVADLQSKTINYQPSHIGWVHIRLISAFKYNVMDAGDGNHYVIARISGTKIEARSRAVFNSATPIFNHTWVLDVPYYRTSINLELIDTSTDNKKKIGEAKISVYSLIQSDADEYFSTRFDRSGVHAIRNIPILDVSNPSNVIGYFKASLVFVEDYKGLYLHENPRVAPASPPEDLSVERLTVHIARFQAVIEYFNVISVEYTRIVEWKDPLLSLFLFVSFVTGCLTLDAEYALSCPLFVAIVLLSLSMYRRRTGSYVRNQTNPREKSSNNPHSDTFQPFGVLRIAVIAYQNYDVSSLQSRYISTALLNQIQQSHHSLAMPSVKISYQPINSVTVSGLKATGSPLAKKEPSRNDANINNHNNSEINHSNNSKLQSSIENGPSNGGPPIETLASSNGTKSGSGLETSRVHVPSFAVPAKDSKELFIGCLSSCATASVARDNGPRNKFSQLISSLNINGLIRDDHPRDAFLHNAFDPWPLPVPFDAASLLIEDENILSEANQLPTDNILFSHHGQARNPNTNNSSVPKSPMEKMEYPIKQSEDQIQECDLKELSLVYPILQPISLASSLSDKKLMPEDPSSKRDNSRFLPWEQNDSLIKLDFEIDESLSTSHKSSSKWGHVNISVKDLFAAEAKTTTKASPSGKSSHFGRTDVFLWRRILPLKSPCPDVDPDLKDRQDLKSEPREIRNDADIKVLLRVQLDTRDNRRSNIDTDGADSMISERDLSVALQRIHSPPIDDEKSGNAISAIWHMRDHIKYVQNLMSSILDNVESFTNIFNWTNPRKTYWLYIVLILTWLVVLVIPGRYLILAVGVYQFIFSFLPGADGTQMSDRFNNLLRSLPNNDDLDEIYRVERKNQLQKLTAERLDRIKRAKLNLCFDCLWTEAAVMKTSSSLTGHHVISSSSSSSSSATSMLLNWGGVGLTGSSSRTQTMGSSAMDSASKAKLQNSNLNEWENVYLVLQNRRLVWWIKESDIDEGRGFQGQLLFHGIAGVTQPSPVDIREIGLDGTDRLVTVFGCDEHGFPLKYTIYCSTPQSCAKLKAIVHGIVHY